MYQFNVSKPCQVESVFTDTEVHRLTWYQVTSDYALTQCLCRIMATSNAIPGAPTRSHHPASKQAKNSKQAVNSGSDPDDDAPLIVRARNMEIKARQREEAAQQRVASPVKDLLEQCKCPISLELMRRPVLPSSGTPCFLAELLCNCSG